MKTVRLPPPRARAFTLLEVIVVLAITALVLSAVYTIAQGTLTLADDVRRAERRDTRTQAFTTYCEHLMTSLPATATLNLITTQEHGEYLTRLELQHVRSPFDNTPDCEVTLFTQGRPGGGLRLLLTCQPSSHAQAMASVVLFDDLLQCEWRVFDPTAKQWTTLWKEDTEAATPAVHPHPPLLKVVMNSSVAEPHEHVFWIAPTTAVNAKTQASLQ